MVHTAEALRDVARMAAMPLVGGYFLLELFRKILQLPSQHLLVRKVPKSAKFLHAH